MDNITVPRYHITQREDGKYETKLENCKRASKISDTQAAAIEAATKFSENKNGGAVFIHSVRETENRVVGRVRDVKTINCD